MIYNLNIRDSPKQIINLITRKELNIIENIFDSNYFYDFDESSFDTDADYDYASESINAERALTRLFSGALGGMIQNIVQHKRIKKSVVASLDDCVNAYGDSKGRSAYTKTVKFLQSHNFINETDEVPDSISFSDLTPDGKKFIKGYYSALDQIEKFSVSNAKNIAESKDRQKTLKDENLSVNMADGRSIGVTLATAAAAFMAKSRLDGGILALGAGANGAIVGATLIALIPSAYNIASSINDASNRKKFMNTMKDAVESAYNRGYQQALRDIKAFAYEN